MNKNATIGLFVALALGIIIPVYGYMGNPRVEGPIGVEIETDTLIVCVDGDLEMYGNWKYEWTPTGGEQTPPDPDEIAVTLANWSVNPSTNVTLSPSSPCNPVTFNAAVEGEYEVTLAAQPDFPGWDEQSTLVTVLASDFILEVVDGNDSANFQFDAINADTPRPVLYVAKNAVDNDISVIMKAPEGSPCEYTSKFKYEVTGNQVTEGESDSGEGPHLVTLSPMTYPDDATFTVKAWYDADNSGDQNGSEPVRYIDVIVLKVEIEKCASAFLPQGGANDNTTTIRAFVTPDTTKGMFKFTLFDVSDEKGYCLNAPTNVPVSGEESDAWKDFQFPAQVGFMISGADSNIAETVANDLYQAIGTIKSFDYGSFGKIKVEFTTQDGSLTCVAKEVGGTNEYTRLPADTNANNIADSWVGDTGPSVSYSATDDSDNDPAGKTGDGFTRYEEWRGFMVDGVHKRLDPNKRDLFVYDQDGIGFGYYSTGSGIVVHKIKNTEWTGTGKKADNKRVMNNNKETASSSNQYGLHLIDGGGDITDTEAGKIWGDPDDAAAIAALAAGTMSPEECWYIKVFTGTIGAYFPAKKQEIIDRTIAHEKGHATGVPHHAPVPEGGQLCPMREPCSDTNIGTTFCITNDNCMSKINVKD